MTKLPYSLRGLLLAGLLALSASCGEDDEVTLGSICSRIGGAFCDKAVTCAQGLTRAQCTSDFQAGCCGDEKLCSEKPPTAEDAREAEQYVSQCSAALKTATCDMISDGDLPAACGD